MSPTKKFSVWLTAIALLVAMVLTPIAAGAKPPASKVWNIYQDKLGAYTVTSAVPKGQTLVAGAYATQAEAQAILSTPPTVNYALTGTLGQNGWYVSDVALDWTVTDAPKVVSGYMQVTGNLHESITADQQATDYTVSATSVGGTTTKTATVARDATLPDIVWNSAIVEGDSFELGTVPSEPTIEASDATSGLDASSLTGYGTAVGAYQLTATATDLAGNMRQATLGYTVFAHPANVVDPTATDETFNSPGVANPGSIVIPTVPGVDYYLDGVLTDGGSYPFYAGTHQVTAQAQPDYELKGYPTGGWTLVIAAADVTVHVTTVAPTKTDQTATAEGFITIPAVTGVNYFIDGVAAAAGDNPLAPGNYAVTAEPRPFYILDGGTSWDLTINAYVNPVTITMIGVLYPGGQPDPLGLPRAVMMDPYLGNGPPVTINEAADTFSYTVPVNTAATPLFGNAFTGYQPNVTYGQYATMTNVPADVDVFATVELSPSLAGQESKFQVGFRSTVYGYPWKNLTGNYTAVPKTFLPVSNMNLEGTDWGAAVGGHHWMTNGVGVVWTGVTGTGSFTVTMHFTAEAL